MENNTKRDLETFDDIRNKAGEILSRYMDPYEIMDCCEIGETFDDYLDTIPLPEIIDGIRGDLEEFGNTGEGFAVGDMEALEIVADIRELLEAGDRLNA